ncbi:MAG: peptidase S10 [Robiginitalea sp.]
MNLHPPTDLRRSKSFFLICLLLTVSGFAQEPENKEQKELAIPEPKTFITEHQILNGGRKVVYKATASETYLRDDSGQPVASIWSVSYTASGEGDPIGRPVTFVFNGGPGSASVWLHMGLLGPELVVVDSEAKKDDGAAPYPLVPNTNGLLDLTDLVFVDPVGTGFSKVLGKGKVTDFWGLNEDASSIAKFIRMWISENNRWMSPKFIAGESFGTTRAVAVANALESAGQNMALNGLILISQALDYGGSTSTHDNITSYITYLPSMAATAWYHKKAGQGRTLEEFVAECREFTYSRYIPALYKGALLDKAEKAAIAAEMAGFIGLEKDYILRSDLRVLVHRFQKELLKDRGVALGRLDGRFMGPEIDLFSEGPHLGDPASYQIGGAFTAAINHYLSTKLQVRMDRPYLTSNSEIGSKWKWRPVPEGQYWEPSMVNVARKLGATMRRNPEMKVMVANGYYDLICPFFDAEYTFARNGIETQKIQMMYYEAGHMMYTHQPDLQKLAGDMRKFLKEITEVE